MRIHRFIAVVCTILFVFLWIHGSLLGLTDDEAYYWILSRTPSWGYAYHPPAVGWVIAFFEKTLGPILGYASSAVVRFPSSLFTALVVCGVLIWYEKIGFTSRQLKKSFFIFLAFPALFGSSWMMVPDLPLFLGWILLFVCIWECLKGKPSNRHYCGITLGTALALLSKFSAILFIASAVMTLWIGGYRVPERRKIFFKASAALFFGLFLALIPILIWNIKTNWEPLRYQIHDRHSGGHLSLLRFSRFWLIEILIAGPALIYFGFKQGYLNAKKMFSVFCKERGLSSGQYLFIWAFPSALVFCLQPLISDFKLHWVFIVWLPVMMEFVRQVIVKGPIQPRLKMATYFQQAYSYFLIAFVLVSCHVPLMSWTMQRVLNKEPDPRWDVTNDMYGWSELRNQVQEHLGVAALAFPLVGSRYQTASQAAFSWGNASRVELLPRGTKDRFEWPELGITDGVGPEWPRLLSPVLFVADNRYTAGPEFKSAHCEKSFEYSSKRRSFLAKSFTVWRCDPEASQKFF